MSDDLRGNHAHPRGARTGHDPAVARAGSDGRGNTRARAGRPTTRYPARR